MAEEIRFTNYEKTPCPYCKETSSQEAHDMPWNDEHDEEFTCRWCEKTFTVEANVSVSWTAKRQEDDEE